MFERSVRLVVVLSSLGYLTGCKTKKIEDSPADALKAMPYMAQTPVAPRDRGKRGVTRFVRGAVDEALTTYCSDANKYFELIDLSGKVVYRHDDLPGGCAFVTPYADGYLLMHTGGPGKAGVVRYRFGGEQVWSSVGHGFHHEVIVDGDEALLLGTVKARARFENVEIPYKGTLVVRIDLATGSTISVTDVSDALLPLVDNKTRKRVAHNPKGKWYRRDLHHCNSLEILRKKTAIGGPGDLLFSCASLNVIGVMNLQTRSVGWKLSLNPPLETAHAPKIKGDRFVALDNGKWRGWSRIVEVDMKTGRVTWDYRGSATEKFYTETRGNVQFLPNGNFFVTESDRGRVFEVTRQREIVWEYWAKDAENATDGAWMRHTLYRSLRWQENTVAHPDYTALWRKVFPTEGADQVRPQ